MWELTTPLNRVVVPHAEARVTLLGARNRVTGQEVTTQQASRLMGGGFPLVREYLLGSIDEIVATFGAMSPLSQEGYVVVDQHFNRVKVKHPGYVAIHHAKDGMSVRSFVEIARTGETPEVIVAFPELQPMLNEARDRFDTLVSEVEATYYENIGVVSQKDFALAVKSSRCAAACFAVRANKAPTVGDFLARMPIDSLLNLLGYRNG